MNARQIAPAPVRVRALVRGFVVVCPWRLGRRRKPAGLGPTLAESPRGDGDGVLVIHGFLTDGSSTVVLRNVLRGRRPDVRAWHRATI
jgi:hypothetical protein